MAPVHVAEVSELEWKVLVALKREFDAGGNRAVALARARRRKPASRWRNSAGSPSRSTRGKIIGRFSTFLEHVKPSAGGVRVTRFNALFHWARAGRPRNGSGRRSGAASYSDPLLLARGRTGISQRQHHGGGARDGQSAACSSTSERSIQHLAACGIPVSYTNVFWGGRSEIKPSEISPEIYREWLREMEGRDAALRRPAEGESEAPQADAAARRPYQ